MRQRCPKETEAWSGIGRSPGRLADGMGAGISRKSWEVPAPDLRRDVLVGLQTKGQKEGAGEIACLPRG